MDHERLRDVCAAIQSVVVSVAVVVGGIWTLVTFDLLEQRRKAQAELLDLTARLDRQAAFEMALDATPMRAGRHHLLSVSAHMKNGGSKTVQLDFGSASPLLVYPVTIGEDGKVSLDEPVPHAEFEMRLPEDAVRAHFAQLVAAAALSSHPAAQLALQKLQGGEIDAAGFVDLAQKDPAIANHASLRALMQRSRGYFVRPGTTERVDYLVRLPRPGLYKLEFAALAPPADDTARTGRLARWSVQRFVMVGDAAVASR